MTLRLVPPPFPLRSPRPAELPKTWEEAGNRPVSWTDWKPPHMTFICPPPTPVPCPRCDQVLPEETASGRIQGPPYTYIRLMAFRCVGCGHCSVYDEHTKQLWEIEP